MLATFMLTGIFTSCVEKEQAPYFDDGEEGTDGNTSGYFIDAKLPAPDMISFYVGDEVIVKGSGFSSSDEIYLRNYDYEYNEDADRNGEYNPLNIKAEIKEVNSDRLTFIVPEEFNPVLSHIYQGQGMVFLMRNGREHKLGDINFNSFTSNTDGYTIYINGERFNNNDKVYYQNIIIDDYSDGYQLIGEKQELPIMNINEHGMEAINKYALGFFMIFVERNGIITECYGDYSNEIAAKDVIRLENDTFIPGYEVILRAPGFLDSDEFILKGYDNNPIELSFNRVENYEYEEVISLTVPQNITDGYYKLIIKRNGIEHIINTDIHVSRY